MERLPFVKLSGAGNDFIVLDARDCPDVDPSWLAARLCRRALSLGADGLILVAPTGPGDVRVTFYNADGSPAEACGNGSRCAARYAVVRGLVRGERVRLLTAAGALDALVHPGGLVEVAMPRPEEIQFDLDWRAPDGEPFAVHALGVGVPHAVVVVPDVEGIPEARLIALGRALRHDARFPRGTNVDVVTLREGTIRQRTYERGVEGLTKACGTGAVASAVVARERYGLAWPVAVEVDGGRLGVEVRDGVPWLAGDARLIASGMIEPEALGGAE